ncbi:hypothetical protein Q5H93_13570 [Hymenobacter sp. ASUV-10]|uniref:Uncharacterized protein n=1 Tax=Hymenobacter aranciens TaxID=3063996 RepID=A0ABT9BBX8_9BACT|nr:hypothetical protein [Hymenobacter sp. ASUV-10]
MTSTIVFIAVGLLLYFLNNASRAPVVALEEGKYNLRMSKAYQLVGLLGIAVSVAVLAMPVIANEYSPEIFVVTGGLFIAIAGA